MHMLQFVNMKLACFPKTYIMNKLTRVWESYQRNGSGCAAFLTKEAATNHDLYEVSWASECEIWLSEEEVRELNQGSAVWLESCSAD